MCRLLAQLLQGQHRRGSQQEGEAQIESQKQGQNLAAHQVLIEHKAAVGAGKILLGQLLQRGEQFLLRGLLVSGVVGHPELAADLQPVQCGIVHHHHVHAQAVVHQAAHLLPGDGGGQSSGVGSLPRFFPQDVVVGEADDPGGVQAGDGGVPVVNKEVPLPGQLLCRVKPGGVQLPVKVQLLNVPVLVLNGDIKGLGPGWPRPRWS